MPCPNHTRHRPEQTPLHALVREHLPAFFRFTSEHYARPLPPYARKTFEQYLVCGMPEHGFLRLRCNDCGDDRIVAFSCKQRGACPSCAGRIMANTAANLVDRVLPNVPIREWVLTLPFELRVRAARDPKLVAAVDRILFREVQRWMRTAYAQRDIVTWFRCASEGRSLRPFDGCSAGPRRGWRRRREALGVHLRVRRQAPCARRIADRARDRVRPREPRRLGSVYEFVKQRNPSDLPPLVVEAVFLSVYVAFAVGRRNESPRPT